MSWSSAFKKAEVTASAVFSRPEIETSNIDWARLVALDFETKYDADYTLKKLTTSEYVRDKRFEALMVGIKVGNKPRRVVPGPQIARELARIPWQTHSLLAHHAQFDGLILSHHYGIKPKYIYCTLSMARGLHSNEIGAGLDEVSQFYGGRGKIAGGVEDMKGLGFAQLWADKPRYLRAAEYCGNDVDEMLRIFRLMAPQMPATEMDIIDITVRLFTDPVLRIDEPRVQKELEREIAAKKALLRSIVDPQRLSEIEADAKLLAKKKNLGKTADDILLEEARKVVGSNEKFADLLRAEGIEAPTKISPAWIAKPKAERDPEKKYAYAFAKTDLEFTALQEHPSQRVRDLVETRLSVKSTGSTTRAGRFLTLGAGGQPAPVYLKYAAAHTLRWGGGDGTNFQNLKRGSELRKSIKAPPNHVLVVLDSSQIEPRFNAWLWGQDDLLDEFRAFDSGTGKDPYCRLADGIYGRDIQKGRDDDERFIGKVGVLMLGYQAGADKYRNTLALGTMGPAVYIDHDLAQLTVNTFRRKNFKIVRGWKVLQDRVIPDMAAGRSGTHKCISWEKESIWLPNGMRLHYRDLRQSINEESGFLEWSYAKKDFRSKLYGGLVDENLVQTLCRIIIADQLREIAKRYRVVMTTHDEIVACVRKGQAQAAFDFMSRVMRTPPAWCRDLPLNCDGGWDSIYSK